MESRLAHLTNSHKVKTNDEHRKDKEFIGGKQRGAEAGERVVAHFEKQAPMTAGELIVELMSFVVALREAEPTNWQRGLAEGFDGVVQASLERKKNTPAE